MISREVCERVLRKAVSTGADYAELFAENTVNHAIHMIDSRVDSINDTVVSGAAVRVYKGLRSVMATTVDKSEQGLVHCAEKAAEALGQGSAEIEIVLRERTFRDIHPVEVVPSSVHNAQKVAILKEGYFAAKDIMNLSVRLPAHWQMWITIFSLPPLRDCTPRIARFVPAWRSTPCLRSMGRPRPACSALDGEWAWKCSTRLIRRKSASGLLPRGCDACCHRGRLRRRDLPRGLRSFSGSCICCLWA